MNDQQSERWSDRVRTLEESLFTFMLFSTDCFQVKARELALEPAASSQLTRLLPLVSGELNFGQFRRGRSEDGVLWSVAHDRSFNSKWWRRIARSVDSILNFGGMNCLRSSTLHVATGGGRRGREGSLSEGTDSSRVWV